MMHIRFAKDFDDEPANSRLRFYGIDPDGGLFELETHERDSAQKKTWGSFSGTTGPPSAVLPKDFWDSGRTEVRPEDLPALDPKTPLLCFWTSTATIEVQNIRGKNHFITMTGKAVPIGFRLYVAPGQVKCLELILLGDQSQLAGTPAVTVIAIRWVSGSAYREPFELETIAYHDWEEIEGRRWKMIIMG
jgi:hypothetical protein